MTMTPAQFDTYLKGDIDKVGQGHPGRPASRRSEERQGPERRRGSRAGRGVSPVVRSQDRLEDRRRLRSRGRHDGPACWRASRPDVMILSRALIDGLARDGHVVAASAKDIGAVPDRHRRATTAILHPPVASAAELRAALLGRRRHPLGPIPNRRPAGIHFAKVVRAPRHLEHGRRSPAAPRAQRRHRPWRAPLPLRRTVVRSAAPKPPRSSPRRASSLSLPLPPGCDLATVYTAAIATKSAAFGRKRPELIALLTGAAGRHARRRLGFV